MSRLKTNFIFATPLFINANSGDKVTVFDAGDRCFEQSLVLVGVKWVRTLDFETVIRFLVDFNDFLSVSIYKKCNFIFLSN